MASTARSAGASRQARRMLSLAIVGATCLVASWIMLGSPDADAASAHRHQTIGHAGLAAPAAGAAEVGPAPLSEPVALSQPVGPATQTMPPNVAELVRQVHQASLVEIWVGQRAQQESQSSAVRWVGHQLVVEHEVLDRKVAELASAYHLSLPAEATLWQQAGARKMARETGSAFDLAFANTLYYGHDRVMGLVQRAKGDVAAPGTEPQLVEFVRLSEEYVARHMQWLLATGMVTTASATSAARQIDTAQVVSRTQTYSNAWPALVGMGSLALIMVLVIRVKLGARRRHHSSHAARPT